MSETAPITLLTDFGESDWFVGSMKGVIAGISPRSRVIDITHRVAPGDIVGAGLVLRCAYPAFPPGTVHLAVVDPGVGTARAVLVAEGDGYVFIAPDNGLLSSVFSALEEMTVFRAERRELFREKISDTFHGRDIFAPLAARIAAGFPPREAGPELAEPVILPPPVCRQGRGGRWEAEIIFIDHFGNCLTSIRRETVEKDGAGPRLAGVELQSEEEKIFFPLTGAYSAVPAGNPCSVWGSCGYLELSVNGEDAAGRFGLERGSRIELEIKTGQSGKA